MGELIVCFFRREGEIFMRRAVLARGLYSVGRSLMCFFSLVRLFLLNERMNRMYPGMMGSGMMGGYGMG
jgi:hypothetical protein